MTRGDLKLLAFLVVAAVAAVPTSWMAGHSAEASAVIRSPYGESTIALDTPGIYAIDGRLGEVVFEVRDGELVCVESTCPDKLCVHMGRVAPGRPVVCAPNGVTAMLATQPNGLEEASLDAVSR